MLCIIISTASLGPPIKNTSLWTSWLSIIIFTHLSHLTDPFTEDEIKMAVFSLGSDKASGPDGFPLLFFQHLWDLLRPDLLTIFEDFHQCALSFKHQHGSYRPHPKEARCIMPTGFQAD